MIPYINTPFEYAANLLGASVDELKLIFSFLLSYPLAGLLKRIPDNKPERKSIFIICVSIFYLVGLFNLWAGARTLAVSSMGAYLIAQSIEGPYMPWIGFVFLMGHLSVNHIRRHIINDPSSVDITGAQMVLVMKLTAFCWNVHDGKLPENELDEYQKEYCLKELPDPLEYAAWVLFFPALFAGPAFDFVNYRRWLDASMFSLPPGIDPSRAPPTRKKRKIPRSGTPATLKAITGVVWIFAFLKFSSWYNPGVILGAEYLNYSILRRIWNMHMLGFTTRMKYYGVWHLTEGACILSGIGYNGVSPRTGRPDWSRLQNVNPIGIELAQNSRAYLGNWNMNTNNWLRNCMYLRVTPKGKKPGFRASIATFVTSAFWHGFEPGYYLSFVLAAFIQTIAKNCRRYIRPFFMTADGKNPLPHKRYYDIASWLVTQLAFSFTVTPFILLTFSACFAAWSRVYFYCVIGVILSSVFFISPAKGWLQRKLNKRNKTQAKGTGTHGANKNANLSRTSSHQEHTSGHMGLPEDPEADLNELMDEVKREVEMRRERGMSIGQGLQDVVQARLRQSQNAQDTTTSGVDELQEAATVRSRIKAVKDSVA